MPFSFIKETLGYVWRCYLNVMTEVVELVACTKYRLGMLLMFNSTVHWIALLKQ